MNWEIDNAIEKTDKARLMRGKNEIAYFDSVDAKLDNYIRTHQEWDRHKAGKSKTDE